MWWWWRRKRRINKREASRYYMGKSNDHMDIIY